MHEIQPCLRLPQRTSEHCLMLLSASAREAAPGDHAPDGFEYSDNRQRFNKINRVNGNFLATLGYSNYNDSPSSEYPCTRAGFSTFFTDRAFAIAFTFVWHGCMTDTFLTRNTRANTVANRLRSHNSRTAHDEKLLVVVSTSSTRNVIHNTFAAPRASRAPRTIDR